MDTSENTSKPNLLEERAPFVDATEGRKFLRLRPRHVLELIRYGRLPILWAKERDEFGGFGCQS